MKWEDLSGEMVEENHANKSDLIKVEERLKDIVRAEIAKVKTSSIPECPVCFQRLAPPKKIVQCLKVGLF